MRIQSPIGTVKITMLKGEKGDKGDNGTFEDLTQAQIDQMADYIGSEIAAVSLESASGTYTTQSGTTATIAIPIAGYQAGNVLFVDIEGLSLREGTDYTVSGSNITLATPITHAGTRVNFRAIKGAWGE